jgi:hypothetical protein
MTDDALNDFLGERDPDITNRGVDSFKLASQFLNWQQLT